MSQWDSRMQNTFEALSKQYLDHEIAFMDVSHRSNRVKSFRIEMSCV